MIISCEQGSWVPLFIYESIQITKHCTASTKRRKHSTASVTVHWAFLCPLNIMCPPWVLPHMCCLSMWVCLSKTPDASVSADVTLPIAPSPRKWQEATSTPPEDFWCVSLYGVQTNTAQRHKVKWTNTCTSLAKNLLSHVFSCTCLSRTSCLLCLLQRNVPPRVCISLSHLCPL